MKTFITSKLAPLVLLGMASTGNLLADRFGDVVEGIIDHHVERLVHDGLIATSHARWAYDPYTRCYLDRTLNRYYDLRTRRYYLTPPMRHHLPAYPVGYCAGSALACPHGLPHLGLGHGHGHHAGHGHGGHGHAGHGGHGGHHEAPVSALDKRLRKEKAKWERRMRQREVNYKIQDKRLEVNFKSHPRTEAELRAYKLDRYNRLANYKLENQRLKAIYKERILRIKQGF